MSGIRGAVLQQTRFVTVFMRSDAKFDGTKLVRTIMNDIHCFIFISLFLACPDFKQSLISFTFMHAHVWVPQGIKTIKKDNKFRNLYAPHFSLVKFQILSLHLAKDPSRWRNRMMRKQHKERRVECLLTKFDILDS